MNDEDFFNTDGMDLDPEVLIEDEDGARIEVYKDGSYVALGASDEFI